MRKTQRYSNKDLKAFSHRSQCVLVVKEQGRRPLQTLAQLQCVVHRLYFVGPCRAVRGITLIWNLTLQQIAVSPKSRATWQRSCTSAGLLSRVVNPDVSKPGQRVQEGEGGRLRDVFKDQRKIFFFLHGATVTNVLVRKKQHLNS